MVLSTIVCPSVCLLEPLRYWTNASSRAVEHAKHDYHVNAGAAMSEFLTRNEKPSQAIDVAMSRQVSQIMERNEVIESLLKITIFRGKQGLALRGHRDDTIDWQASEAGNQGNFAQLMCFRAEIDPVMAEYLQGAPKNAQYTSKTIQNELVTVIGDRIRESVINEVKDVKFHSLISDEVTATAKSSPGWYATCHSVQFVCLIEVEELTEW